MTTVHPVQPYKISVPQSSIDLLHQKLALTRLPSEIDNAGNAYGARLSDIKRLVERWRGGYSWRDAEAKLNQLPQYTTQIGVEGFGSLKIHFIHHRSPVKDAIPLVFVHGWPGSFLEATKILPELVKGGKDFPAFDVVVPSLPNYAFSQGVDAKGFGLKQYAESCHKLMLALGYDRYVSQGGDWGYFVTRAMAKHYGSACLANHVNLAFPSAPGVGTPLAALRFLARAAWGLPEAERRGIERARWFEREGNGYLREQATRPQTLAYGLDDSPVGLLAWIYEKLVDWTDGYPWADDDVLTWISIYWFSAAGPGAAARIYYETEHDPVDGWQGLGKWIPDVKLGVARFPAEIALLPKDWNHTMGPLVFESEHESGGHFAAWERPDAIVGDLRKMFGKDGPCAKIVPGKAGYEVAGRSRL